MAGATPDYALFADALDYPGAGWAAVLARMDLAADPSGSVAAFAAAARELPLGALQEIYTATFDMQPDMTLSTGFHLFGDDYQRSDFLVRLSGILRARQFAYGAELPDHACLLLRFLAQAAGGPEAEGLAEECLAPALARVAARLETQNAPACSPYRHLLRAITAALPPPTLYHGASA
ncbi:MAG: nitrate reductase molybdenum cofactor assembly chaperone [Terriglobales bacterium]